MPTDEPRPASWPCQFDLDRALSRFDVVAVLRVTEVQRLGPPTLATEARSRVVVPLKGAPADASLPWTSLGDFWFPQRGSECLCALQRTEGEPAHVVREWAPAAAVLSLPTAPDPLLVWARAQVAPVPCAQCETPLRVRNRSGLAREVMRGLVFCPRHVPALHVHVAEVVRGVPVKLASPAGDAAPADAPLPPGTRFAVDLGLARRGVFPDPGAPFASYEIDGQGKRTAVGLLPMATFADAAGAPVKRSRRCPHCGVTYGSVRPLGICPSCKKKHLADLPELLD
ncbi:MAG: hypothetical protein AAB434_04430 [Planctomycetota bacterium]